MGSFEEFYEKNDNQKLVDDMNKNIIKYNNNVDLAKRMIPKVLTNFRVNPPTTHGWKVVDGVKFASWELRPVGGDDNRYPYLLSNGDLYTGNDKIQLSHIRRMNSVEDMEWLEPYLAHVYPISVAVNGLSRILDSFNVKPSPKKGLFSKLFG